MNKMFPLFPGLILMVLLLGCEQQSPPEDVPAVNAAPVTAAYVVLDESLQQLRADFNANKGKIRLLFLVGDTCGICLRGMADLNDAFIARAQEDDRLVTLVVHVPTLGAQEKHVPAAIPLLEGPRVFHYWDGVGKSGVHFGETLATDGIYAWDVWMAYGPQAEWAETVPPAPEFWMHQLGSLDRDLRLDADVFAEKTLALMVKLEAGGFAELTEDDGSLLADGTVIPAVAQPKSVAVSMHIRGVGGFQNLKTIKSIRKTGQIIRGSETSTVEVVEDAETGLTRSFADATTLLPLHIEKALADSWQMNGSLYRWKARGNQLRMDGMLKVGKSLAWKLYVLQQNGMRGVVYVNSHTGDIVLASYLDEDGQVLFSIRASDFRAVDGFSYAFKLEYLDADRALIATENYADITLIRVDVAEIAAGVTH